ncbi:MAG: glutamine--fructose-6-phosphate transaminase (isomerizing) [Actinobacteria bacterium]|nr:glutamine--fructose-6-phosphate transaminase (isomerizing) [Actinomycetota bacterium]MBU1865865.1 glutamine--fructose-6-phosphate transaminase (isomerizing) [Actinomycetota bacterium]
MCGIMGYVGPAEAAPILIDGLQRLEYRGYDSAGIAVHDGSVVTIRKAEGKLERLVALLAESPPSGSTGIGHTRWATHGPPTDFNAHPHTDPAGDIAVVHNGIIENFLALREELGEKGSRFTSDTDTEILAHLIADEYEEDLLEAVRRAVRRAEGAYALVAMSRKEPGRIVAVRMISPLIIGLGEGETFLASDIPAILHRTRRILVIENGEIVDITADGVRIETLAGAPVARETLEISWNAEQAEKGGYPHFMIKEIFEQPDVITETLSGRIRGSSDVALEGVGFPEGFVAGLDKIWITACGTAYHAGLVGKEIFERKLRIPVDVVYAHELRYRDPIIRPNSLTIAISQSGETADTLAAAELAKGRGSRLLAITNVVGSTLSRISDDVLYTRAGPEIAVASTKAYLAMLIGEYLLTVRMGRDLGRYTDAESAEMIDGLRHLPQAAEEVLGRSEDIARLAEGFAGADDVYFLGRGVDYAVAMEGSLKMKEISYIHSEAMPAGELKHGTLALVTRGTPVVTVLTQRYVYDKTVSAIMEVKARGAHTIAVAYDDDGNAAKHADEVVRIPRVPDSLSPVLSAIPLQLLAYYVAVARGHDIDQPRNLAKSVTVE